ncbi:LLM class flavin-dependent oxidoreductase [Sandaracinobacteroides saxicola]|uniref:Luciferase-like monooxygenase n=1 Tax=Sandaracinobacteroides saxicola TaxID=2759707 RepID=A0A7G5ILA3_9SPHN|nr:LLM class flavin-dependent oxidoreductase [Sandaracinobacteroides saxicola]QMW24145.1 LLM class flavin-dependent oxidoreductase [Sandaracinobacteroides saxicola]
MTLRLSVLDQSPIAEGGSGGQALRNSLDLARQAEVLGYHRFWMAEHHATPGLASASPELMLAAAARETARIRLGTGGVMLPHYSPFKVAESFSMLAGLAPGRIDLGLGRAPGSDGLTAYALQQDRGRQVMQDFPQAAAELLAYFEDDLPAGHPFAHLARTLPGGAETPDVWMLGSSPDSAMLAAALGLPYCFADFIAGAQPELTGQYRDAFRPSVRRSAAEAMVALWCIAAPSEAEARWLAGSARMMFAHMMMGQLIAVPHPDVAAAWLAANPQAAADRPGRRVVVGTPAQCRAGIEAAAADYGADEVMLVNILYDHVARVRSYALVAEAFEGRALAA